MIQPILLLFVLLSSNLYAQTRQEAFEALMRVSSTAQIEDLKEQYPEWNISLRKILPTGLSYDSTLFEASTGDTVTLYRTVSHLPMLHKVIAKGEEEVCKVEYIFLDGKRRSQNHINQLRSRIIEAYKSGTPFLHLNRKYSEDGNPTGVLDWFCEGMMDPTFDAAVRSKPAGHIFTVDIPNRYWYYVVLKKEQNKMLPCTYVIQIQLKP
jgi:hypothetical protein